MNNGKTIPKKLILGAVAAVVVIAIIIGIVSSAASAPAMKVVEAAKKTLFDAESLTVNVAYIYDGEEENKQTISCVLGKDFEDSMLYCENENDYTTGIYEGKIYVPGDKEDFDDLFDEYDEFLDDEFDLEVSTKELADEIINKGIDEKAVEKIYNKTIRPAMEDHLSEEFDVEVELPEYDEFFKLVEDFAKDGLTEEALTIESQGKNKYSYKLDYCEFLLCLVDYADSDRDFKKYKKQIIESGEIQEDEFGELKEELRDSFDDEEIIIEGEVHLDSKGYISFFSFYDEDEEWGMEITISDINKTEINADDFDDIA